ncbi:MAG TPA: GlxA family transcriptional regulator [Xanthomonadaceae bacterium]|nr:GlxA family transcriptional regulator [Xanthomonadaceae bacterium]
MHRGRAIFDRTPPRPHADATDTLAIGLLAYEGMQALDLTGPLDVFGAANAHAGDARYRLCVVGLGPAPVRAENGLVVVPECGLDDAPAFDTLLVPGGAGSRVLDRDPRLLGWLRARAPATRRMVSVCTGIYLLAAAGLLDGRRVTTHWEYAADVARRYPALRMEPDQMFVRDGAFATSGGLTAGMDLALALVEEDCGAPVALAVARHLVMYLRRPGNQAQFSEPLLAQSHGHRRLGDLVQWLLAHLGDALDVERMAARAAMSPRHLRRVFRDAFGTTPMRFVERLRMEQACLRLSGGNATVERIAAAVGFNSADAFRRAFRARYGVSPAQYRERFCR